MIDTPKWPNNRNRSSCKTSWESVNKNINSLLESSDQFLIEKPLQPKRAIQEYVSSHGTKTPKRYNSLLEAVNSWKKFIIRSEHPQEYDGISWLSDSIVVNPDDIIKYQSEKSPTELENLPFTKEDIKSRKINWEMMDAIAEHNAKKELIKRIWFLSEEKILNTLKIFDNYFFEAYAHKMNLDINNVLSEQSYTFYEYIPGINHSIIADKDTLNRYYIISNSSDLTWWACTSYNDWIIIQDWKILNEDWSYFVWERRNKWKKLNNRRIFNHDILIQKYNEIRKLWKFDSNHCPVMEFQTPLDNSSPYFLQYHRLRDKRNIEKESFILDRDLEEGEFESPYFRWTTSPEWIIVCAWFYYEWFNLVWCTRKEWRSKIKEWNESIRELEKKYIQDWEFPISEEEASFDFHHDIIFQQIMSKKRLINFQTIHNNEEVFKWEIMKLCDWHSSIAKHFKADMFVTILEKRENKLYNYDKIYDLCNALRSPYRVKIRVISDGERCYVKPITTKEEVEADYKKYVWESE